MLHLMTLRSIGRDDMLSRTRQQLAATRKRLSGHASPLRHPVLPSAELSGSQTAEVLEFLSARPVHTVVMTSMILDNGITSELNRGKFYGYRNHAGELEGVALIGHSTLVEARSPEAIESLAIAARNPSTPIHLIMSSGNGAERFYEILSEGNSKPRLRCVEALFEASLPFLVRGCSWNIEHATSDDLQPVAEAQAEIALAECGVDPMTKDPTGFLERVRRRIAQKRVFVVKDANKMIFKADIIAETADTIYLEGVYVHPDHRGRGLGSECLSYLTRKLLERVDNVCLLSNVDFSRAHRSFLRAGYRNTDHCITLFV
jgi:GNAT superfamily N-acetyltransferase